MADWLDLMAQVLPQMFGNGGDVDLSNITPEYEYDGAYEALFQEYAANDGRSSYERMVDNHFPRNGFENVGNKWFGKGLTTAEIMANQFSADEAQKARDFEERMSNTAYQRQVADMQAAGVNPALTMGGGSNGASVPSSPSPSSVSPVNGNLGELIEMMKLPLTMKAMRAEIKATEAETSLKEQMANKTYEEALNKWFENEYADEFFSLRAQGLDLSNAKTREDISNAREYRRQIIEQTNFIIKQSETEGERKLAVAAERILNEAREKEIIEMLPLNKALVTAQTEAEENRATLMWWQAVYEKRLVESGQIDALVDEIHARAYQAYQAGMCSKEESELIEEKTKGVIFDNKMDGADDLFNPETKLGKVGNFVVKGISFVERHDKVGDAKFGPAKARKDLGETIGALKGNVSK